MGSKKDPIPHSFSIVTSRNVRITPKTCWLLVFTLLPHWCKILRPYLVPVPSYWTWTKSTPQKNWFFWWNSCKIEVLVTSLIEMLVLPNFGHITTSTIWFESRDKILLKTSWTQNYDVITFNSTYLYFKKD